MKRLVVFPLIRVGRWVFRTSVADSEQIMILAFGPDSKFLIRYFMNDIDAKNFVDATSARVV
jgi:hypothetical protein